MNSFTNYINRNSFIHRMNPSLKLIISIFLITLVFMKAGFFVFMILILILAFLWFSSKLPWRMMSLILKSTALMFILLFVINWMAFKSPGFTYLSQDNNYILAGNDWKYWFSSSHSIVLDDHFFIYGDIWGGQIYSTPVISSFDTAAVDAAKAEGFINETIIINGAKYFFFYKTYWYSLSSNVILFSLYVSLKIFLMIVVMTILISTTTSVQLSFAIESIFTPLKLFRLPVNEWATTISIAIRFVPSLLEESQRILKAQASRGVDFTYGSLRDKIKALISLVVPMFSVAFHKSDDLANAMEARSYNPRHRRTRYRRYKIYLPDWIFFAVISIIFAIILTLSYHNAIFAPFGWIEVMAIGI